MPKPGCSFGAAEGAACSVDTPGDKSLQHALMMWGHESSITHIPRGCPETSRSWHGQRALALPGARSRSHRACGPVPCASAPQASGKGSPPGAKAHGLAALGGGIPLLLPGQWARVSFLLAPGFAPAWGWMLKHYWW